MALLKMVTDSKTQAEVERDELQEKYKALQDEVEKLRHSVRIPKTPRFLGNRLENLKFIWLGPCHIEGLSVYASWVNCKADHMLFGSLRHDPIPSINAADYDAAIVGLTLRTVLAEVLGPSAPDFPHVRESWNEATINESLERCTALIEAKVLGLRNAISSIPIFFVPFLEPSFDFLGNLNMSADLTQIKIFVSRLNQFLLSIISRTPNCYWIDLNEICNYVGRMHLQDDIMTFYTHAVFIGDHDVEPDKRVGRIVPPADPIKMYDIENRWRQVNELVWDRLLDNIKIIRQIDAVKLIIVDLDDTLWRGIAAEPIPNWEGGDEPYFRTTGWPMAFAEALLYFKKRGGLIAICSKNDYEGTRERFANLWGNRIKLDDFVSVKINWKPKSENIAEILNEVNLLPESAVFVDDNPREVDEVKAHFPAIRTLGFNHYDWRRIILSSPETQVASISKESAVRTELVRAHIDREHAAEGMNREEWLHSLELEQRFFAVTSANSLLLPRTMELVNKTNQFNTTGKRWLSAEFDDLFASGGLCLATSLKDKTTDNGIIGVAIIKPGEIVQCVLSCRVFSLGAEIAMGSLATTIASRGGQRVKAEIIDTGKNFTCHDFYEKIGFNKEEGVERLYSATTACALPEWIRVIRDDELEALLTLADA